MQKTPKSPETYGFTQIKKAFSAGLRKPFSASCLFHILKYNISAMLGNAAKMLKIFLLC